MSLWRKQRGGGSLGAATGDVALDRVGVEDQLHVERETLGARPVNELRECAHRLDGPLWVTRAETKRDVDRELRYRRPLIRA